jgi:hypothetical protein
MTDSGGAADKGGESSRGDDVKGVVTDDVDGRLGDDNVDGRGDTSTIIDIVAEGGPGGEVEAACFYERAVTDSNLAIARRDDMISIQFRV